MHYTTPLLMLLVASSSLAAPPQKTLPQKALPQKASPAHPSPSPSKAVGTPTNQRLPPYKSYTCTNEDAQGKVTKTTFLTATLGQWISGFPEVPGRSGYPEVLQHPVKGDLDAACKNKAEILSAPVFKDPPVKIYNFDSKPKDPPGPFRVLYARQGKVLCGMMAHKGPGSAGAHQPCTGNAN